MSHLANILVVEDEAHLAQGLLFNLRAEGYTVQLAVDGETALEMITADSFDAVILDVMLPGTGWFLRRRRTAGATELRPHPHAHGAQPPRRRTQRIQRRRRRLSAQTVRSFHPAGASQRSSPPHGVASPGAPAEPAQPPRAAGSPPAFTFAGRTIHFASLQLTTPDKTIRLTLMEADLLRYLVLNQGRIISRKELLEQVWRVHEDTDTRAIDNFMVRLRRYIEDNPAEPVFLETVRGIGYRFLPRSPGDSSGEREEKPK